MADLFDGTPCQEFKSEVNSVEWMEPTRRGDWAELTASLWLMEEGYEVFRNMRTKGPIDLVAVKDGKVRLIDVKFAYIQLLDGRLLVGGAAVQKRPNQRNKGIEHLYVSQHGICAFSDRALRSKYRLLTGYENPYPRLSRGGRHRKEEGVDRTAVL